MSTIRHENSEDTGEQDVRELRSRLTGGSVPSERVPRPRVEEDALVEGAFPDLLEGQGDEVDEELSFMVDSGELHFGWDDERQEFVYWVPEGEEEVEHTYSPVPAYAPAEEGSAPKRGAHRARKVSKVRSRVGAVTVASLGAFLFGMVTEAALAQHAGRPQGPPPNMEQDTVSDESRMSESPSPTPTVTVTRNSAYVPALSSTPKTARHAKPSPSLSHEVRSSVKPKAPGKHRKPETAVTPTAPSANTPQTPPRGPSGPKPPAGPPPGDKGPVGQVLDDVLSPIGRALR